VAILLVASACDAQTAPVVPPTKPEIVGVDVGAARVLRRFAAQKGADGLAYVTRCAEIRMTEW
jgi:hypothetical protein